MLLVWNGSFWCLLNIRLVFLLNMILCLLSRWMW